MQLGVSAGEVRWNIGRRASGRSIWEGKAGGEERGREGRKRSEDWELHLGEVQGGHGVRRSWGGFDRAEQGWKNQ